jgi:hypothetical protein
LCGSHGTRITALHRLRHRLAAASSSSSSSSIFFPLTVISGQSSATWEAFELWMSNDPRWREFRRFGCDHVGNGGQRWEGDAKRRWQFLPFFSENVIMGQTVHNGTKPNSFVFSLLFLCFCVTDFLSFLVCNLTLS